MQNFQLFNSFQLKQISILIKDISPFIHFEISKPAIHKFYFWMRFIEDSPDVKGVKFDTGDDRYTKYHEQSNQIVEVYHSISTTEIWNMESVSSTVRQKSFYHEAGLFLNRQTTVLLYEKLLDIINHVE